MTSNQDRSMYPPALGVMAARSGLFSSVDDLCAAARNGEIDLTDVECALVAARASVECYLPPVGPDV